MSINWLPTKLIIRHTFTLPIQKKHIFYGGQKKQVRCLFFYYYKAFFSILNYREKAKNMDSNVIYSDEDVFTQNGPGCYFNFVYIFVHLFLI